MQSNKDTQFINVQLQIPECDFDDWWVQNLKNILCKIEVSCKNFEQGVAHGDIVEQKDAASDIHKFVENLNSYLAIYTTIKG